MSPLFRLSARAGRLADRWRRLEASLLESTLWVHSPGGALVWAGTKRLMVQVRSGERLPSRRSPFQPPQCWHVPFGALGRGPVCPFGWRLWCYRPCRVTWLTRHDSAYARRLELAIGMASQTRHCRTEAGRGLYKMPSRAVSVIGSTSLPATRRYLESPGRSWCPLVQGPGIGAGSPI